MAGAEVQRMPEHKCLAGRHPQPRELRMENIWTFGELNETRKGRLEKHSRGFKSKPERCDREMSVQLCKMFCGRWILYLELDSVSDSAVASSTSKD
jgi:hypothetical protein